MTRGHRATASNPSDAQPQPTPTSSQHNALKNDRNATTDDAMDVDSEDFETSYFTLDFGPDPPQNISSDVGVSFTGLETEEPYVQIGDLFFKGRWAELIGTEIIVGQDEKKEAKVIGMTRKRLVLERVNLKKRTMV